ncbi:MAG TPA: hypothetical protein VKD72_07335 [Gemmataceae bacterium]|nr:hypothetical protein [Gemmataceae bacterium]
MRKSGPVHACTCSYQGRSPVVGLLQAAPAGEDRAEEVEQQGGA